MEYVFAVSIVVHVFCCTVDSSLAGGLHHANILFAGGLACGGVASTHEGFEVDIVAPGNHGAL